MMGTSAEKYDNNAAAISERVVIPDEEPKHNIFNLQLSAHFNCTF